MDVVRNRLVVEQDAFFRPGEQVFRLGVAAGGGGGGGDDDGDGSAGNTPKVLLQQLQLEQELFDDTDVLGDGFQASLGKFDLRRTGDAFPGQVARHLKQLAPLFGMLAATGSEGLGAVPASVVLSALCACLKCERSADYSVLMSSACGVFAPSQFVLASDLHYCVRHVRVAWLFVVAARVVWRGVCIVRCAICDARCVRVFGAGRNRWWYR